MESKGTAINWKYIGALALSSFIESVAFLFALLGSIQKLSFANDESTVSYNPRKVDSEEYIEGEIALNIKADRSDST